MKKFILVLFISVAAFQTLNAQTAAIEEMLEYQKGQNKHATVIELPYPPETVENAIKQDMAKRGLKPEKAKGGLLVYRGVRLQDDTEVSDLHFKVERKSKKEKDVSKVHLIVGRSSENITLRDQNDSHKSENGKSFLNGLVPTVASHQLDIDLKDKSELIKKAEKKLKFLTEDQKEYEKKIISLQEKLIQNKKDQETQTAEILKQRGILDALQGRKTS
jgi:hypothetical protein